MAAEIGVDVIERQEWMEPVEEGLQSAVTRAYEASGNAGQRVKNFLHGTWLGHPLHPVLTDIPIGAWTAALVLDTIDDGSRRRRGIAEAADTAVGLGLAAAVPTAIAGLTDWQATDGAARRVGLTHGLLNIAVTALFTTSWLMRRGGRRRGGKLFSLAGYGVAMGGAYLGGHLVYKKQIGIDHTAGEQLPEEFVAVLPDVELLEGQLRRVNAEGVKVLLVRQGGQIRAIAEVCSHLGGPLAEGEIVGETVRCPWHGSRYSLETGQVIDGPSTHNQPCLEARVRDGQIEVRLKGSAE
ncbi:MAG TPA: Rieske 2Fe-2S domain-containing protein [Bryobacteraceae bacterium]|nr:Rieske 2Fe-2S domain-containing protein [Bryobacteraceae bacterium]